MCKMRWHPLAGGYLICLDSRERRFRVEFLHNHDRAAKPVHRCTPAQRRSMVKRRWRQINAVSRKFERHHGKARQHIGGRNIGVFGQRKTNALWLSRRARTVQHVGASALIGHGRDGHLGYRIGVIFPAGMCATEDETRHRAFNLVQHRAKIRRGKKRPRPAVLQDIIDFGGRKPTTNGNIDQPRPLRAPDKVEKFGTVFKANCHRIAMLKPKRPKQMGTLVGTFIQLLVCNGLARTRHDDGWFVGVGSSVDDRMAHVTPPASLVYVSRQRPTRLRVNLST